MCNASFGLVARNNIIAEGDVDGIWPDCGSIGIALYGNTIYGTSRTVSTSRLTRAWDGAEVEHRVR